MAELKFIASCICHQGLCSEGPHQIAFIIHGYQRRILPQFIYQISELCKFRAKHFNLQRRIEKSIFFGHSEISYDLVNSQMNTEIVNKQMDFNEAEISFSPFYTNIIFLLLIFHAVLHSYSTD